MRETVRERQRQRSAPQLARNRNKEGGGVHTITDCSLEERRQIVEWEGGDRNGWSEEQRYILELFWRRTEKVLRLSDAS